MIIAMMMMIIVMMMMMMMMTVMVVIILMSSDPSLRQSAGMHTDHSSHQIQQQNVDVKISIEKDRNYKKTSRDVDTLQHV